MCCVLQVQTAFSLQDHPWCPHRESQRAVQTGEEPGETGVGTQRSRHRPAQTADVSDRVQIKY